MEEEGFYIAGDRMFGTERKQLPVNTVEIRTVSVFFQLDAEHRKLLTRITDSDQRGTKHLPMGVEDRLAWDGKEGLFMGHDPVCFATAEPDAALLVTIAKIAHAMVETVMVRVVDFTENG